ncbi:hypothetical protein MRS44_013451 [Fusarium solani]|uniref:uncharacterized protein n=1 Tax=Fusarium solani TaxID=169388 RepID=UPI0032C406DF|nr:hypothetical protein MRS44_013451 [Fusarium solani]
MALTSKPAILPRSGNGFGDLASRSLSPRQRTSLLLAQNIEKHLFREHGLVDESGKRKPPALWKRMQEKTHSRNIVEMLNLDTSDPKEQPSTAAMASGGKKNEPPFKRLKAMSALERHRAHRTSPLAGRCSLESSLNADHEEYNHWLSSPDTKNDPLVTDPIQHWWERRKDYPRLSRMALDLLSVPPMSAECKRLFSVAGQMVSPLRTRLEASTIGITQTLRLWVRNGLIDAVDTLIDVSGEVGNSIIWEAEEGGSWLRRWGRRKEKFVYDGDLPNNSILGFDASLPKSELTVPFKPQKTGTEYSKNISEPAESIQIYVTHEVVRVEVLEGITVFDKEERPGDEIENMPEILDPSAGRILPLELVTNRLDYSFVTRGVIENNAPYFIVCNQLELIQ